MAFFNSAVGVLQTLVVALGAGLGIWGAINLLEGYGNDNRAMRSASRPKLKRKSLLRKQRKETLRLLRGRTMKLPLLR